MGRLDIPPCRIYDDFGARSKYLRQVKVIAYHSLPWGAINFAWLKYLLLVPKSSYVNDPFTNYPDI